MSESQFYTLKAVLDTAWKIDASAFSAASQAFSAHSNYPSAFTMIQAAKNAWIVVVNYAEPLIPLAGSWDEQNALWYVPEAKAILIVAKQRLKHWSDVAAALAADQQSHPPNPGSLYPSFNWLPWKKRRR